MNTMKGSFDFKPRKWQVEFSRKWTKRESGRPFMLVAIPGGGKTYAALEVIREWMAAGADRRCLVVVPTDNLREQWRDEGTRFGLNLQTKEFGTSFKHDYQGGVVTYHLLANQPLVFRKLLSVAPTIAVFDEIHHCGEDAHFGRGVAHGCGLAKEKLLMSGTPWKSDGTPIPYVSYDGNGYVVADYGYDYPRALMDEVVRYLTFAHAGGEIRYDSDGRIEPVNQDITHKEAQERLRRLLDPKGDYIADQIHDAHRKLIECRRDIPDAGGLVACIDQQHASQIADAIRKVTNCEPSVIVSDNDRCNDSVKRFRACNKEWLVTVRKVSEGVDIKRLQVLCYFTNITAELFFRQLIGRVSRVRGLDDFEAYVYLPADPRLVRCAQNIANAQVQALVEQTESEAKELDRGEFSPEDFEMYSTSYSGLAFAMIGNREFPISEYQRIEQIAESTSVSMEKVARVLEAAGKSGGQGIDRDKYQAADKPKEERMDVLRRKCNRAAFRLSKQLQCHVKKVHGEFRRQNLMTESELEAKLRVLLEKSREVI
jgi:superfamily II DNA or RNA helicase